MVAIIERIRKRDVCTVVLFDEPTILEKPIEEWPICDYLLCFESGGFPLDKGLSFSCVRAYRYSSAHASGSLCSDKVR